ncbi:hypothetical protein ACHAWO_009412 [Cyclotella atomus]|uniref:Uncharacterized protein n=1 Tax=Cyclotella atomus TaxID=382360 RepID=A0ABD3PBW4_9STRA
MNPMFAREERANNAMVMVSLEEPLLTQPLEEWRSLHDGAAGAGVDDVGINDNGSSESDSAEQSRLDKNSSSSRDTAASDRPIALPMFHTAGKKMEIHASNEGLSKAAALFSRADDGALHCYSHQAANNDQVNNSKPDAISAQDSSLSSDKTVHKSIGETGVREPILVKDSLPVFQTAGKNRTIQVSNESLLKANDFFSGVEDGDIAAHHNDRREYKPLHGKKSSAQSSSVQFDSDCNQSKPVDVGRSTTQHLPLFQTAGKNVTIYASAESLTKANDMFSADVGGSSGDSGFAGDVTCTMHIAQHEIDVSDTLTQNQKRTTNVSEERDREFRFMPMFQTAGKKQTIQVSTESVSKANTISSKLGDGRTLVADSCSEKESNTWVSAASVPQSVFRTAGKGIAVKVSAESLSKVDNLFSSVEQEAGAFLSAAQCNDGKSLSRPTYKTATANTAAHESSKSATSQLRKDVAQSEGGTNHFVSQSSISSAFTSLVAPIGNTPTTAGAPRTTVFNPYANRRQIASPKKRTIAQVNQNTSINSNAKVMKVSTNTAVSNPYAKSKSIASESKAATLATNNGRQSFVKNPYATKNHSPKISTRAHSDEETNPKTPAQTTESSISLSNRNNPTPSVPRPMPTSRFFSMADRLPSRNVSYKPAEILSIGELYRYLYHQRNESAVSSVETVQPAYRELASVRITGVLLSSTYSDSGDGYTQLYGKGQLLLIGDPLEKTRFAQKPPPKPQKSKTPLVKKGDDASVNVFRGSATPKPSNSTKTPAPDDDSIATPLPSKPPSNLNKSTGLLNDKKRKLVYNKAPGKNSLSSSRGLMNAKKFQTPKRIGPDSSSINSIDLARGCSISSRSKGVSQNGKNRSPSSIIQCHPSPIVPVWNGSTRDGNGLDGSVIGDLVMIMGEIVVESCESCKDSCEDTSASEGNAEDSNSAPKMSPSGRVQDVRDAARLLAAMTSSEDASNAKTRCTQCVKFLRARFVKNANGTDMNLQKEALRVRREYMKRKNDDMTSLFPSGSGNSGIESAPFL